MRIRRPVPVLACLVTLLHGAAGAAPAPRATPADLQAFVKALPAPGRDRVFLAPDPALQARLAIDPAKLRGIDPGIACDPAASLPASFETALGTAGNVTTTCTPDGRSQGLLTLADDSVFLTICGKAAGMRLRGSVDVSVGGHSMHASTDPAPTAREPAHDCTGWTRIPH